MSATAPLASSPRSDQVTLPTVTTTAGSTGLDANDVTIAGTVNPEGAAASYHFDYGIDTNYGTTTDPVDAGAGTTPVAASAQLTGLAPATTYHFRIVATSALGTVTGVDRTFSTGPAVPVIQRVSVDGRTVDARAIMAHSATLQVTVDPGGAATTYHFEYGTDTSYGSSTPDADAGATTGPIPVTADLTGLQPGTTYHFRAVAHNSVGDALPGADLSFTTAPATLPSASRVTASSATLQGVGIPGIPELFTDSKYHFEYGTDTSYGSSTVEQVADPGTDERTLTSSVAGLRPGTVYHFRLVVVVNGR